MKSKQYFNYPSSTAAAAATAAKSLQSCPTLCNPVDGSPPGSAVPGIGSIQFCAGVGLLSAWTMPPHHWSSQ